MVVKAILNRIPESKGFFRAISFWVGFNKTTVIIILIFIGSIMMISLGIIGYYVARIYDEIKGRPKYIVSATCRSKEKVK